MYFIFPPHLTCASVLPGETENRKSPSFHLNAACFLPKKHTKHNWMHHTGPRILLSVTHMLCVNQVCRSRSLCKRWELFFLKPQWKSLDSINGISYYLNKWTGFYEDRWTDAIKHITDDNFSFRRQCTGALCIQHSPTAAALSTNIAFEWKSVIFVFTHFAR